MKFPDSYFEDEVRDGFYVSSIMKCCWASQLKVLGEIDRICKKYNIQYFAEWGTLLGVVRHGGYIPWDDDMDISMKRKDYELFLRVAPEELPERYEILNYKNDEHYWDVMARVVNADFADFSPEFLDENYNCPYACGVDIFPLDYVSNNKNEEKVQKELVELVKTVADTNGHGNLTPEELEQGLTLVEKLCRQSIDREGNIKNQLYKIVCSLYALYEEKESDRIALMAQYLERGASVYPKECYADSVAMPFDSFNIPVPVGYDAVLKLKYGDYMKNVRSGGGHDYPIHERQDKYLRDHGVEFSTYEYPQDLKNREKAPAFKETLNQKINLLKQIHEKIEVLVNYGQREVVLNLLQELQNVAIAIGDSVERKVGSGSETVSILEQYCEVVFELYNTMSQNLITDGNGVRAILDEVLQMIEESAHAMHIKKEIVFIPYRANQWKAIESVWRAACADEECDVKVVPVPYYYKRRLGEVLSEMQYDGNDFPDYVTITPFEQYSVENNHPDKIYIQSPYDKWNHTVTVHKNYYSDELWKNTEELIYIPWFKIDEMRPDDDRALHGRKYYVPMPGVVNADKVILQSEGMKQSYVDYLTEWAGEDTRSIWEGKLYGTGSPLDDAEPDRPDKPAEWGEKKVILYHISGNGLMEHKEKMLDKIEKSMEVFEAQSGNIQVVWLQDISMKQRLMPRTPGIYKRYERLVEKYGKSDWVNVMEADAEKDAVMLSDAFYGDAGKCAQSMKQLCKPVMLQNVEI